MSDKHKKFYDSAKNFDKDYFVNSSISNYDDYRNKKFDAMAETLIDILDLTPDVSVLDFGCVLPDCEILTEHGYQTIDTIQVGDKLYNGEVTHTFVRDYTGDIFHIKPMFLEGVWFTSEHPILVAKKIRSNKFEMGEFKRADELNTVDDYIVVPKINVEKIYYLNFPNVNSNSGKKLGTQLLDETWAQLFGWYLAEGFKDSKYVVGFSLGLTEITYANEIIALGKTKNIHGDITMRDHDIRVRLFSVALVEFLGDNFGNGAKNKRLPKAFLSWENHIITHLLDTYVKGDGHKRKRSAHITCISVSKILIRQIQLLLLKIGFPASYSVGISPSHLIGDWMIKESVSYRLEWDNSKRNCYEDGDNWYFKIRKIEQKQYSGIVHNLETTTETYQTPFTVHNCANGGLLYSLKERGIVRIKGTDISNWSIQYGLKTYGLNEELEYFNINLLREHYDILIMLDVLEHVPSVETIEEYMNLSNSRKVVVRIPISIVEGAPYVLEISRNDKTHVQCHTRQWWLELFNRCGYVVDKYIYRHPIIWDTEGVLAVILTRNVL